MPSQGSLSGQLGRETRRLYFVLFLILKGSGFVKVSSTYVRSSVALVKPERAGTYQSISSEWRSGRIEIGYAGTEDRQSVERYNNDMYALC